MDHQQDGSGPKRSFEDENAEEQASKKPKKAKKAKRARFDEVSYSSIITELESS